MSKGVLSMDGEEIKKALGINIKKLRSIRRYSQAELAEKADISIIYLSNIERGQKFPKPAIIAQLSKGLSVEVHELFKINSEPNALPIVEPTDNKKMLKRLSKTMTRRVNNTIEDVFKIFLK